MVAEISPLAWQPHNCRPPTGRLFCMSSPFDCVLSSIPPNYKFSNARPYVKETGRRGAPSEIGRAQLPPSETLTVPVH